MVVCPKNIKQKNVFSTDSIIDHIYELLITLLIIFSLKSIEELGWICKHYKMELDYLTEFAISRFFFYYDYEKTLKFL